MRLRKQENEEMGKRGSGRYDLRPLVRSSSVSGKTSCFLSCLLVSIISSSPSIYELPCLCSLYLSSLMDFESFESSVFNLHLVFLEMIIESVLVLGIWFLNDILWNLTICWTRLSTYLLKGFYVLISRSFNHNQFCS